MVPGFAGIVRGKDVAEFRKGSQQLRASDGGIVERSTGQQTGERIRNGSTQGGVVTGHRGSAGIVRIQVRIRQGIDVADDFEVVTMVKDILSLTDPPAWKFALNADLETGLLSDQ